MAEGTSAFLHAQSDAQLALCDNGVARFQVGNDAWFVPSKHGIWIPSGRDFHLSAQTTVEIHRLYVDARTVQRMNLLQKPTVVRATPLLGGIAQRLASQGSMRLTPSEIRRLAHVAFDEIARLDHPDLRLPGGHDPRLTRVMDHLVLHPQERRSLSEIAQAFGTSERTLARLFKKETGMTFSDWRRRLRFMYAIEQLAQGETSAALSAGLGYSNPSAFIAAFRKYFGAPPSSFRDPK
ncbi:AraC family transcriptional regulator [Actibacterium lipolyticum]|uniref:HTH-type transcriptional repressor of iron proteins A n=1 Tax=Actibacterium lipolyticum TaxID=1524263 RepID=A0A238JRD6_9RHOB|nr:AraC family transcriptional regulator [Actibacterium lipolyticum]SMX33209.1 HTH-type transcriptional repressor of iron proteins A [Actibacterium lipolyticum]